MEKPLARRTAKGNRKPEVFRHTLTHLRGPSVVLVRTLRVEPDGATNQRSSAANTVPARQSADKSDGKVVTDDNGFRTDDNGFRLVNVACDHLL